MDIVSSLNLEMCSSCVKSDSEETVCPYSDSVCIFCSRNHHCLGPRRKKDFDSFSSSRFSSFDFSWSKNDISLNMTGDEKTNLSYNCGGVQSPEKESEEKMDKGDVKEDDFLNNGRVSIVCIKPSKHDLIAMENLNIDIEDFIGINPPLQQDKFDYFDISINRVIDSEDVVEIDSSKKKVETSLTVEPTEEAKLEPADVKKNAAHASEIFLDCLIQAFEDKKCFKNFCLEVMGMKFYVKLEINKLESSSMEVDDSNCAPSPFPIVQTPQKKESFDFEEDIIDGTPLKETHLTSNFASQLQIFPSPLEREPSQFEEEIIDGTPLKQTPLSGLNLTSKPFSPSGLNTSVTGLSKQGNVIASSGVTALEKVLVRKFCEEFNYIYTDSRCQTYSILVFKNPFNLVSDHTFKYYLALASKAAIVGIEWVIESIKANTVLPLRNFLWTKCNNLLLQSPRDLSSEPLFMGITLVKQLLNSGYPGAEAIEHLLKLTGAFLVNDISDVGNSPCPRFILYQDEQQLTSQLLSKCSQYSTVAVDLRWIYDCLERNEQLPISEYQSSTFSMSPEIYRIYHIPPSLFSDE